jgi:hypothetical protein
VILLTLGSGLWLLLTLVTDYSLIGTWTDLAVPPLVLGASLAALPASRRIAAVRLRWLARAGLVPTALLAGIMTVAPLLLLVPPLTLGGMFTISEMMSEHRVQETISPDGLWVAAVDIREVGIYSGGTARMLVQVYPRWFPVVEETVWSGTLYGESRTVQWADGRTLDIPAADGPVPVGSLRLHEPAALRMVAGLIELESREIAREQHNQNDTGLVRDVPLFPAPRSGEYIEYGSVLSEQSQMFRAYSIAGHSAGEIESWHVQALAQPPWSVVRVRHRTEHGGVPLVPVLVTCIEVARDLGGGQSRSYSWVILPAASTNPHQDVRVIIDTPAALDKVDCQPEP